MNKVNKIRIFFLLIILAVFLIFIINCPINVADPVVNDNSVTNSNSNSNDNTNANANTNANSNSNSVISSIFTCSAQDVVVDGNYAYVADINAGLQIVDISIPSNVSIV